MWRLERRVPETGAFPIAGAARLLVLFGLALAFITRILQRLDVERIGRGPWGTYLATFLTLAILTGLSGGGRWDSGGGPTTGSEAAGIGGDDDKRHHPPGFGSGFSGAGSNLLEGPAIAVGVAEEDERAPRHVLNVADLDSTLLQLRVHRLDIGHDHLQPFERSGRHRGQAGADGDRAGRAGRGELHEAEVGIHLMIVIRVEAELLGVEVLGAIHVRDGDGHEFQFHVHGSIPLRWPPHVSAAAIRMSAAHDTALR